MNVNFQKNVLVFAPFIRYNIIVNVEILPAYLTPQTHDFNVKDLSDTADVVDLSSSQDVTLDSLGVKIRLKNINNLLTCLHTKERIH